MGSNHDRCKDCEYGQKNGCAALRDEPGCYFFDQEQENYDPKAAARLLAWEEMGACIAAGMSTDHIAAKYDLED